jgi:hypothetical protein
VTDNLDEPLRTVADEIKGRRGRAAAWPVRPFALAKGSFTASLRSLRLSRHASVGTRLEDHLVGSGDVGPRTDRGAEGHRFAIELCWGLIHPTDIYTSR